MAKPINKPKVRKQPKLVYTGSRNVATAMVVDSRTRIVRK